MHYIALERALMTVLNYGLSIDREAASGRDWYLHAINYHKCSTNTLFWTTRVFFN